MMTDREAVMERARARRRRREGRRGLTGTQPQTRFGRAITLAHVIAGFAFWGIRALVRWTARRKPA